MVMSCHGHCVSVFCFRREVAQADSQQKQMIPLLLEKIAWPPKPPVETLKKFEYIDCATLSESVQNSWKCKQFDELLQILSALADKQQQQMV